MTRENNNEIQRLEEKLSHQHKTIEELSEVVTKQWQSIDRLEKKVSALVERFLALEGTIENTKPPHY